MFRVLGGASLLCAVALAVAAPARSGGGVWAGEWKLGTYTMVVTQSGSTVTGLVKGGISMGTTRYDLRFTGTTTVVNGVNVWQGKGTAVQNPKMSYAFHFEMSKDLLSISGKEGTGLLHFTRVGAAPATTEAKDSSPPVVRVVAPGGIHKPGTHVTVTLTVRDDSGKATMNAVLLDGGTSARTARGTNLKAKGEPTTWNIPLQADLKGPLYVCAWAQDAAGNKSAKAPRSSCAYISLLVDIDLVSNTCGGEGWDMWVAAQNTFGNTSLYEDEPTHATYKVNFADSCNLHDAGYGGHTVYDKINKELVDYHSWSRARVDTKFQTDMWQQCHRQIAPVATSALKKCIRDSWRYNLVHTAGSHFFDADLLTPGVQATGQRDNS